MLQYWLESLLPITLVVMLQSWFECLLSMTLVLGLAAHIVAGQAAVRRGPRAGTSQGGVLHVETRVESAWSHGVKLKY